MNQNEMTPSKTLSQIGTKPRPNLESSWLAQLESEFDCEYMQQLSSFLEGERSRGKKIFPKADEYFAALNATSFDQVRVVILGQDPYHGPGQAHGLSFSVPNGIALPPSLKNIFKELHSDLHIPISQTGNLTKWAEQGVLLLNSVLTVEMGQAASHQKKGWEQFTDVIIQKLNEQRSGLVFILWGAYAQKKANFVDRKKHLVLESVHPSPLSCHRGFFGTQPFSKVNTWLIELGQKPIDWRLEEKAHGAI